MSASATFTAILYRTLDPARGSCEQLPLSEPISPTQIRVSATFVGAAAVDVYELADATDWPISAMFIYTTTLPRTD